MTEDRSVGDWTGWAQEPAFMCASLVVPDGLWLGGTGGSPGLYFPQGPSGVTACYPNRLLVAGGLAGAMSTPLRACYAEEVVLGRR